jgi:xanthine dehydrogenase accessory factor
MTKMKKLADLMILVRGGGEAASAVAHRLRRSRFLVVMTEIPQPLAVSRGTCFCEAVFDGTKTIEGVTARLCPPSAADVLRVLGSGDVPVVVDPETSIRPALKPDVFIDAAMRKRGGALAMTDAPLTIGLGPGFYAGRDAHIVVETNHDGALGRVITEGEAEPDTGRPISIGGLSSERVLWAPSDGVFETERQIADSVGAGETVASLSGEALRAPVGGVLRGLLRSGVRVGKGNKIIEVDPVSGREACFVIRDRVRAIAGGVLEAVLMTFNA